MQNIRWSPFSDKHIEYIHRALDCKMSVAEGSVRAGKTIDNCIIACAYLEECEDKVHLASGSTIANAKLNIGYCNGFGLECLFAGRCKWGKFRDNEALFIKTKTGEKIVVFAGGGKADSYKKILGNSYGLWIATEINEHYDCDDSRTSFIKVALARQIASKNIKILWDLNPCNPHHRIYTDYIDNYRDNGLLGGYNYQHFTYRDNWSLSERQIAETESMWKEGTIWYKRDILGERCVAEGLIYKELADDLNSCVIDSIEPSEIIDYAIGVDFGEARSSTTFALLGLLSGAKGIVILEDMRINEHGGVSLLERQFEEFCNRCIAKGWKLNNTYYDNEQRTLGKSLESLVLVKDIPTVVKQCVKDKIIDRIRLEQMLLASGRLKILKNCKESISAFQEAVWSDKKEERLDEVSEHNPVDMLDAIEYAFQKWTKMLLMALGIRR